MSSGSAQRTNRLAHHLLQIALVLFLVGAILTILAVWGRRSATASAAWRNPAETIHIEQIALDLAALSLAGAPDDQVLALSMETGELESTHALLAFSPDLTDQERVDGWLWLAQRYLQAGRDQVAAQAYRLAGSGSVLSEGLPDLLRTKTLLSVGRQLGALHDKINARFFLRQAALLGARTPYLTTYHRRLLFEELVPALLEVGGQRDDWSALQEAISAQRPTGGSVIAARSPETSVWSMQEVQDAALIRARNDRRAAAEIWLASIAPWQFSNPIASEETPSSVEANDSAKTERLAPDQARQALRQALLAEDAAVTQYLVQQTERSDTRLLAQETYLRWLLLKRRIAWGSAGKGLVPEWESDVAQIDAALAVAWNDWLALQSPPPEMGGGTLDGQFPAAARWALVAAYWGLFPDAPIEELVTAVNAHRSFGRLQLQLLQPGSPPVVGWSE